MYTMDTVLPSHHEECISPSLPHIFSNVKPEPADYWNSQLHTINGLASENPSPCYTPLETVHPDSSYGPSLYSLPNPPFGNLSSYLPPLQPPHPNAQEDSDIPILQPNPYRHVDLNHTAKDEGLGSSSPSSFNSITPPLVPPALPEYAALTNDFHCNLLNERGSTEDIAAEQQHFYPPECGNCGSRMQVMFHMNHYLCSKCLSDGTRPAVPQPDNFQNDRKRKRSTTANKKENQLCTNCETANTTLWRRSLAGLSVCNACGLYEKLHKHARPKSMRKDNIQQRKRKPKSTQTRTQKKKNSATSKAQQPVIQRVPSTSSINSQQYPLPTYNSIQARTVSYDMNHVRNTPLPPMNGNPYFHNYRPEMYNLYHAALPIEIMDEARGFPPTSHADSQKI